jgi:hypothetical protein
MAHTTLLVLPADVFRGDDEAQLVGGDNPATPVNHKGRPGWAFDDTDEEAVVSAELVMPANYAGGTLTADVLWATASDNTNDLALDLFVEAITPNADTLDMEAATSWDSANSGTASVAGSTAGDLQRLSVTLTNKDNVVAGDLVRIGIRRDTDSANDDIVGDVFVYTAELWETT